MGKMFKSWMIAKEGDHFGALDSTVIQQVMYCSEDSVLRVFFHSGRVYDYFAVPQNVFEALVCHYSVGSYYNQNIKSVYNSDFIGYADDIDPFEVASTARAEQRKLFKAHEFRFKISHGVQRIAQFKGRRYYISDEDGNNLNAVELPWGINEEISIEDIQRNLKYQNLCKDAKISSWWIVSKEKASRVPNDAKGFVN